MLLNFLLSQTDPLTERRVAKLRAIGSEADFQIWQASNRKKFLELIGGLPGERAPLNARIMGEFRREGYTVRKVVFESLPEYYVTANLYIPHTGPGPFPAVLAPCGHSVNGKAYDTYQHLFIGLARRGYVVLTYDPMGQGERYQYYDFLHHEIFLKGTDNQHAMAGLQETLLGQNLARYMIWDGIRALDYLVSLPEVDASHVGMTGSSGGGTLTAYVSMLDPRVKVASIVTFVTSLRKKIQARALDVEADPEQDIPGLLSSGLDNSEFVSMIAPRPVMMGAATRDFLPIEGTRQAFAELQELYRKLGVPERLKMAEFDHRHMYSQPLREATYAWFDHWLKGVDAEAHEPEIATEKDETLQCTPTGQVITSLGGKRVYDFNHAQAERVLRELETLRRSSAFHANLAEKIRNRLALSTDTTAPPARTIGENEVGNLVIEKLLLETEPGIVVPTRLIYRKGLQGRPHAVVYLRDRLGEQDSPDLFASLARQGKLVAVADVRGFGETWAPRDVREQAGIYFLPRDGTDADFAYAAFFLGRTLLGMRVGDALGVVRYLRTRSDVDPQRVTLMGRGWAGVTALFAASVDSEISATAVEGIPASYGALATAELYEQPAYILLPGALQDFDLTDVFASLVPRPLLVMNPQDPLTRKMFQEEALAAFAQVVSAYQSANAPEALEVKVVPLEREVAKELVEWHAAH
jgi:cephalosporin-C deacetylase-like acetyl esterase